MFYQIIKTNHGYCPLDTPDDSFFSDNAYCCNCDKNYISGPALVEPQNRHMKRLGKDGKVFRLYKFRSMPIKSDVLEKTFPLYRAAYEEKHSKWQL